MDATFWALVALVLFFALIAYMGVPKMVTKVLDARADRISNELLEARRLREEAQQLLAEYQRKRKKAEAEAQAIVSGATREAESIVAEAREKSQEYVARRTLLAEQKIARAEQEAIAEVRGRAVDIAVAAAARILAEKVPGETGAALFESSLQEVKARMN